jgi:hypothetical protein
MKRYLAAAVLLISLTSCASTDSTGASDDAPVGNNRPSQDPAAAAADARRIAENQAAASAAAAEVEADDGTATFGQTYTWEDDISVTVSEPVPFQPSEYSAVEGAAAHMAFTVTVVNGSASPFDLTMFTASAQSGNTEAEEVFDSSNGFSGSPSTKLLPGRESVFKVGFGVSTPDDIVLQVSPSFEHTEVLFTS